MKKILFAILFVAVLGIFGFLNRGTVSAKMNDFLYQSPCNSPKHYSVGNIDARFTISNADFSSAIEEAANVWNTAYGKNLFLIDPKSAFAINLDYDSRQTLNKEIDHLNDELKERDTHLKPEIQEYNRKSADLDRRIKALNEEIQYWNSKGGAPEADFNRLRDEQASLKKESAALNEMARSLQLSTKNFNNEVEKLNETVTTYNDALNVKPEGGKYVLDENGERIEINVFDTRQDLINILAHEMGHSLGMQHVEDPTSIMYYEANSATTPTEDDLKELARACAKQNVLKLKYTEVAYVLQQTLKKYIPVKN